MSGSAVRGWCPGAYAPMPSGDGLIVRVRPYLGRVSQVQVQGLCDAARDFGNGFIDLTNRANLQLRGVTETRYPALLDALQELDLVDPDPETETRRNMLLTPFRQPGDTTDRLGQELIERLHELPELPAKFGFVIDCGDTPVLGDDPGDIRIERSGTGGLVVRADGQDWARAVEPDRAIDRVIELAHWFAAEADETHRRMAHLSDRLPESWQQEMPAPAAAPARVGAGPRGLLLGAAFGSMNAAALSELIAQTGAPLMLPTPWRMLFLPGVSEARRPGFVSAPHSPLLRASACPGVSSSDSAKSPWANTPVEVAVWVSSASGSPTAPWGFTSLRKRSSFWRTASTPTM